MLTPPTCLSASKPLKVILDIRYPYAIMASLSRHCPSVPSEPCAPASRSFPLPHYLCAPSFHVLAHKLSTKLLEFRPLFSTACALFHFPYPVSPVVAALSNTTGVST